MPVSVKIQQLLHRYVLPGWYSDETPDARHPHRRRHTAAYRRRRELVKWLWIGSGLIMLLAHAAPHYVLALALTTAFLSFMILDEHC